MRAPKIMVAAGMVSTGLLLSGCTGGPVTVINVTAPGAASVGVSASFTGMAADTIRQDQAVADDLKANMTRLTGSEVVLTDVDGEVRATASVSVEKLSRMRGITGVESVSATVAGEETTVTVSMVQPVGLVDAIGESLSSRPDAAAMTDTLMASATVTASVVFPGGLSSSSGQGVKVVEDSSSATVTRPVTDKAPVSFTATGKSSSGGVPTLVVAVAALIVAAGALYIIFRRKTSTTS